MKGGDDDFSLGSSTIRCPSMPRLVACRDAARSTSWYAATGTTTSRNFPVMFCAPRRSNSIEYRHAHRLRLYFIPRCHMFALGSHLIIDTAHYANSRTPERYSRERAV
jgi:hypothetical protein